LFFFNQTINFSSTINATLATQPVNLQFVNVTFGDVERPSGLALDAAPDFSTFTIQSGCILNSKIALSGRWPAELRNPSLYFHDVKFVGYGKVVESSRVGISGFVLDVSRVAATIVGNSEQGEFAICECDIRRCRTAKWCSARSNGLFTGSAEQASNGLCGARDGQYALDRICARVIYRHRW
jgi:hypothetical protein